MKKMGFVIPWFGENITGGAETALRELAIHLLAAGVDLEILTTCVQQFNSDWGHNYYKPGTDMVYGITVRRFLADKRDAPRFDAVNIKLMQNQRISRDEEQIFMDDMINSRDLFTYIGSHQDDYSLFIFTPYMFGTTYYGSMICPEKSILIPCFHDESYIYLNIYKKAFSNVRGMVFLSRPEADLAQRVFDLSAQKTAVLGCGLDTDMVGDAQRFRDKFKVRQPFILYAGRKDEGKNVHTLIRYFEAYKNYAQTDLKLVLIGGGTIALPQSVENDIIDLGFVSAQDKYDACAASIMLCQPSKNESFSLVIMESWICGRPILVNSECAVTKDFAITAKGGLYFSNLQEFVGCLDYFMNNSQIALLMGENGHDYVIKNFSWNAIVKRYMDYYKHISEE